MASQRVQVLRRVALLAVLAIAACSCCGKPAFVGPVTTPNTQTLRGSTDVALRTGVAREAMSGEYTGFVPDMQRRTLMNLVCVAATGIPVVVLGGGYLYYFYPPLPSGAGGGVAVGDITGKSILLADWMKTHRNDDRELVQGLKGTPTYLVTTDDGIKNFGIEATCTHLGCVVPWVKGNNKFCCPCHGSQYDANGKVVRGPAPLSLPLVKTSIGGDGKISVAPWTETDFRDGSAPWWAE